MKQKPDNPIFVSKAEERRYHMSKKKLAEQKKNSPKCPDPKCCPDEESLKEKIG